MDSEIASATPLLPGMRMLLWIASGLVVLAGIDLFVLTDHTDRTFAWTIDSGMTAAFLGAGYLSAFSIEYLGARRRTWADARLAVPAVLVFTLLTLIATLLHLGKFHLSSPHVLARLAAWLWLMIYVSVPLMMIVLLWRQSRLPRRDPPRTAPLPGPVVWIVGAQAATMLVVGALLFVAPDTVARVWPWPLTQLTGRAVGAWVFAVGVAAAHATIERDAVRVSIAAPAYALFGALELVAVTRYGGEMRWDSPSAWMYVVFLVTVLAMGAGGVVMAARGQMPDPSGGLRPSVGVGS